MFMPNVKNQKEERVIIFTGGLTVGGAEKQSMLLAMGLKRKCNVLLVSYYGDQYLKRNIDFLVNERINYRLLRGSFVKKAFLLIKIIIDYRPSGIINFLPSNNVLGGFLGKVFFINCIIGSVRTAKVRSKRKYWQLRISHKFFNNYTVFNSVAGYEYYKNNGFSGVKASVIQNCIYPIPPFCSRMNKEDNVVNILIVARFEKYKDYTTSLEAFKIVADKYPHVCLKIVGVGPNENDIRKKIKDLEIGNRVDIAINPEDVNVWYLNSDIFLQTSLIEGFSNSIMEAMAYSLPIVATNVGDNKEMVINDKNGYLFPIKTPNSIADGLEKLIRSKDLRQQMGAESYQIISENFSVDDFSEKFFTLISAKL